LYFKINLFQLFLLVCKEKYSTLQIQKESPFVLDVTNLPNRLGSIIFDGNDMPQQKRRFWILEKAGTIKFTVVKHDFMPGSLITISGFKTTLDIKSKDFLEEVYIK